MSSISSSIENNEKCIHPEIFDRCFESPIDINVLNTERIELPKLKWNNYKNIPQNMQLENSGETCKDNIGDHHLYLATER